MKKDSVIINTSRGGIINEEDLYYWLLENKKASAVVDTFEIEPYKDKLIALDNIYLTPHLGSCTKDSRRMMEEESLKNIIINESIYNRVR